MRWVLQWKLGTYLLTVQCIMQSSTPRPASGIWVGMWGPVLGVIPAVSEERESTL